MSTALPKPPMPVTGYTPGEMGRRSRAQMVDLLERTVEFRQRRDLGPRVWEFITVGDMEAHEREVRYSARQPLDHSRAPWMRP